MRSRLTRLRLALSALVGVLFVLLGWPALLLAATVGPLQGYLPDVGSAGIQAVVVDPGGLLLAVILAAAAGAWFVTAAALVVELATQASGVRAPRLGRVFPQASMSRLAGAALIILPASGVLAPAAMAAPANLVVAQPATVASISLAQGSNDGSGSAQDCPPRPARPQYHRVRSGETLWGIADTELGRGERYPELFRASKTIRQPGGQRLTDPDVILPGWRIRVPSPISEAPDHCEPGAPAPTSDGEPLPELDRGAAVHSGPAGTPAAPPGDGSEIGGRAGVGAPARATGPATGAAGATPAPVPAASQTAERPAAGDPASLQVTGLRILQSSVTEVRLGWDATPGASWYWVQLGGQSIRVLATEVVLEGLAPHTHQGVSVRAVGPDGRWGQATEIAVKTAATDQSSSRAVGKATPARANAEALLALRPSTISMQVALARAVELAAITAGGRVAGGPVQCCQMAFARSASARRIGATANRETTSQARRRAEALGALRLGGPVTPEDLLGYGVQACRRGTAVRAMIQMGGV